MIEIKQYCIIGGESTSWYMSEEDAISDLSGSDPGDHNFIVGLTLKYDPDTGYVGDIALTSVLEYITPGVG